MNTESDWRRFKEVCVTFVAVGRQTMEDKEADGCGVKCYC